MLQFIRDKSQGVIAIVVLGFVCLTFAFWGIHNYFDGSPGAKPVVKVNSQKISAQDFNTAFERYRQANMQQNPQLFSSQKNIAEVKAGLLQSLVQKSLLTQSAMKSGFSIGQGLMMLELARMPLFQVDGEFSKLRFQQYLTNLMFSQQQFVAILGNGMLLSQVQSGFVDTSFALPYQVDSMSKLLNQTRSFSYIYIPASHFLQQVKLPAGAVQQYYASHKTQYTVLQQVSLGYISLSLQDLMTKIHPSDNQLMTYYQNSINHYTKPKQWQLAHILVSVPMGATQAQQKTAQEKAAGIYAQAKAGANFAQLAAKNSADTATANNGGIMPWINLLQVNNTWQKKIIGLRQNGQLTQPFKTQNGYEIVKLVASKPSVVSPFNAVKTKVENDYKQENAQKQFSELSDRLSSVTFEHPDSLAPAAKQLGLTVQTMPLFDHTGGKTALTKNPRVIEAAFSSNVLGGNNSDAIAVSDTQTIVVRANKIIPESTQPLASVQAGILQQLEKQQSLTLAKTAAMNILTLAKTKNTLTSAAGHYHVETANNIKHNTTQKITSAIVQAAFQAPRPTAKVKSFLVAPVDSRGFAVIAVNNVKLGSLDPKNAMNLKDAYLQGIMQDQGELDYNMYVKHLQDTAKIKYYHENEQQS